MAKRHYIPITADVPGVNEGQRAFIRKVIRTALAAEGVDFPCEVDVLLTNDEAIHQINLDMREVDRATDVLSFPEFDLHRFGGVHHVLGLAADPQLAVPVGHRHIKFLFQQADVLVKGAENIYGLLHPLNADPLFHAITPKVIRTRRPVHLLYK